MRVEGDSLAVNARTTIVAAIDRMFSASLIETLPARRTQLLRRVLELLPQSSKRAFPDMEDQALPDIGDLQGMGGAHEEICALPPQAMPTR